MSTRPTTFVERCLNGEILATEIDDVVDAWHDSDDPRTLREYLGFSNEEYQCWLHKPDCVRDILFCRDRKTPFMADNQEQNLALAARCSDPETIFNLDEWLPKE